MSNEKQIDFFISYTKADEAWAKWIAWQLEDAADPPNHVVFQAWDFPAGGNFVHEIQKGLTQAKQFGAEFSRSLVRAAYFCPTSAQQCPRNAYNFIAAGFRVRTAWLYHQSWNELNSYEWFALSSQTIEPPYARLSAHLYQLPPVQDPRQGPDSALHTAKGVRHRRVVPR